MAANVTSPTVPVLQQLFNLKDPRTAEWVFLKDPKYIVLLLTGYLYMVKVWGPRYMKDRKPYNLNRVIQCYNIFQIVANVYFCSKIAYLAFGKLGHSMFCQGLHYNTDPVTLELLDHFYYYLWVRIIDFADTLFFVLKKKFTHITQLHVIHHTIVVFSGWQFMQFGADGQTTMGVCINSMIHIIMYSYYFLAALGPYMQPFLWWKKYLTSLQIVQFIVMIGHALIPVFVECNYPRILLMIAIPQAVLILGLFVNFYIQSYINQKKGVPGKPSPPRKSIQNGNFANAEVFASGDAKKLE